MLNFYHKLKQIILIYQNIKLILKKKLSKKFEKMIYTDMNSINSFKKKRYILLKNFFLEKNLLEETNKVIIQAKNKRWKFIKVYYNAYIKNFLNIFAISYPLHNFLESNLDKELYKINYKKVIKDLTGWNEIKTTGIEIQHNEKYNYQSTWHRDWSHFPSNCLNIIIYLKDEVGFRIVPLKNNHEVENITLNLKKNYLNIPNKYYDIINAKAGDILVMDSGLLHQGFAKGNRTHIFIRCEEKKNKTLELNNFANDYSISEQLDPNIDLTKLKILSEKDTYNFDINYYSLKNKIESILYTFLYYLPIHKLFKYIIDFKKKKIHFHYTFFQ